MSTLTQNFIERAIHNALEDEKCSDLHPGITCNAKMVAQFAKTCQSLYKMYLLVHLVPFLLFKRKKFKQKPVEEIKRLLVGFVKSMLFAGGYTLIVRRTICFLTQHYKNTSINGAIGAFVAGISLNFEPPGRQSEIALFCLNKTMETLYNMGLRRNYPIRLPHGECLILGVAIGVICFHFADCPSAIRENYLKVLDKIIGSF